MGPVKPNPQKLYDPLRKKKVAAHPEEKVRQSLVRWLIESVHVPQNQISTEFALSTLGPHFHGRADLVVWKPNPLKGGLKPWLLVECKAPSVVLDQTVSDQVRRYAQNLSAEYVLVSNGTETRYFKLGLDSYGEISTLPSYTN